MNLSPFDPPPARAFTRLECLAALAGLALLSLVTLPLLAAGPRYSEIAACANNLRQIGQAMRLWAHDHEDEMPWRVLVTDGGTKPVRGTRPATAFVDYYHLRDLLSSPQILLCPSDSQKRAAKNWTPDADGGFLNSIYRDNGVSYLLGLDTYAEAGFAPLSGDRNLKRDGQSGCSAAINAASVFFIYDFNTQKEYWTNGIHGLMGNILFNDGGVELANDSRFYEIIHRDEYDNGNIHFIIP